MPLAQPGTVAANIVGPASIRNERRFSVTMLSDHEETAAFLTLVTIGGFQGENRRASVHAFTVILEAT
ncbi:hypothetical protein EMQ_1451 [Acetobacter aceti NBRC 14818]|uniref:Uncharacterized protein n=1 Tax=Acetobacter aceti NBRC 14818 TaxID=887700 RepID=A0AB33IFN4_ACEAC|nr:hypothetical protein EMQ_1451 [Acetobacter aceti NBRC 14818]